MPLRALSLALALLACATPSRAPDPAARPALPASEWARSAVFYEVFVRSFFDSDGDGNGDLKGLVAKLDYLNDGDPRTTGDLGVDALWLMPVFKSPSYHGYDTTDYETINRDYGTNEDFARLCAEAHRRGMKVILDLVLNHTSWQHPWFLLSSSRNPGRYHDWYVWRADDPGWTRPWDSAPAWHCLPDQPGRCYYGLFWGGMPDLDLRNPEVREELKWIAKLWLDRGADGFRLDAIRHLVETGPGPAGQNDTDETHAVLREFAAYVRSVRPDAFLVGEAWTEDTSGFVRYFGDPSNAPDGGEIPALFDFSLSTAILDGLRAGSAQPVAARLEEIGRAFPPGAIDAPFLTNHDQLRIATQLDGDPARLRTAAAILLTLPGAPFVYYGEELGLRQPRNSDDEFKRTPMPWSAGPNAGFTAGKPWQRPAKGYETANVEAEARDPGSLLSRYRTLIRLRHASESLRTGALELLPAAGGVLAFLRKGARETTLVVHNLGDAPGTAGPLALPGGAPAPLLADPGVSIAKDAAGWSVAVPPRASGVWRLAR